MIIIFCTFAVIWAMFTIADNSPERRREKAAQRQAERECDASMREAAALAARTPEQVAADRELAEAREVSGYYPEFVKGTNPEAYARTVRAIERRRAAYAPAARSTKRARKLTQEIKS